MFPAQILIFVLGFTALDCCFQPEKSKLNFLCPIDFMKVGGFQMVVTPMKEVLIECENLHSFKVTDLPNVTISKINLLQFRFCPLPEKGFAKILKWFATEDVALIEYEHGNFKNQTLAKNYFKGLAHVRFLKLSKNFFGDLEDDVFANTPNLIALELKQNNLRKLKRNFFKKTQLLEWLDVTDNLLENLPSGLFSSLEKLEYLRLWGNRITQLEDFTFDGLANLKSLELSANKIQNISENAFQNLKNLANLSLAMNQLRSIPLNLFKSNTKLQSLKLNDNSNLQLTDYMFANFSLLQEVDLSNCNLKKMPEHIFENSVELRVVILQENQLTKIPRNFFATLIYLEEVDLAGNRIESIDNIFKSLTKLKTLSLQNNAIQTIHENTFSDLIRLEKINLEGNQISYIHPRAFFNNDQLKIINLSKNQYSGHDVLFKDLIYLQEIDLSHNLITQVEQVLTFDNKPLLEIADLRHNLITNISLVHLQGVSEVDIHLDSNKIISVNFEDVDVLSGPYTSTVHLRNNPLRCDCHNFELLKYFKGGATSMFSFPNDLMCASPEVLKGTDLEEVPLSLVTCALEDLITGSTGCPPQCSCSWRPFDTSIIIDCANRNLTQFPKIESSRFRTNFSQLEVILTNNSLVTADLSDYDNVTKLFLSHNKLMTIASVPKQLKVLELDHNHLTALSFEVLQALNSSLTNLTLDNNPWLCACGSENMSIFIRQHTKELNSLQVYCSNSTIRLIDLNRSDLCHDFTLIFSILIVSMLVVLATSAALYYRYQQQIKVFLFSQNLCLWWVSEEDLDKDKIYDAFISYSHADEDFVVGTLVPVLEEEAYNLCLHFRDWVPGELINKQIVDSVVASKRTIVVLSENFLESVWGRAEFRQAHAEAMADGRARVIVVVYGEVDIDRLLDDDIKAYLRTNTYVEWGDLYFWDKLKYALPHRQKNGK